MKKEWRQTTVRLPPEVYEQAKNRADERGMSLNEWLTKAITAALASKATVKVRTETEYRV